MERTPEEQRALSEKMRKLGQSRSAKKRASSRNTIKAAHQARWNKPYGYKKPKK
jgi:hypothetical protein